VTPLSADKTLKGPIRIPRNLPPCWWVVTEFADGSVELRSPRENRNEALKQADYWRDQAKSWIEKPARVIVAADSPQLHYRQRPTPFGLEWTVGARWNWFGRHRKVLTKNLEPTWCHVLTRAPRSQPRQPAGFYGHRIGGPAVLPPETPWPTFTLDDWATKGQGKKSVFGTFVGVYDLRGDFALKQFPAAISIFLCAERVTECCSMANPYCPVGKIVPLYPNQRLQLTAAPSKELELPAVPLADSKVPDFPPLSTIMGNFDPTFRSDRQCTTIAEVYAAIEAKEPGTSRWIHLLANKIGGYAQYLQEDLVAARSRATGGVRWRQVATYIGDEVALGDAGILYILAGWDSKRKAWRWHCEWQCH
jgi:hypothetical protein